MPSAQNSPSLFFAHVNRKGHKDLSPSPVVKIAKQSIPWSCGSQPKKPTTTIGSRLWKNSNTNQRSICCPFMALKIAASLSLMVVLTLVQWKGLLYWPLRLLLPTERSGNIHLIYSANLVWIFWPRCPHSFSLVTREDGFSMATPLKIANASCVQ